MRGRPFSLPSSLALLMFASAMSSPCPVASSAQLVVGIQSEPMGGIVSALHVVDRRWRARVVDRRGDQAAAAAPASASLSPGRRRSRAAGGGAAQVDVAVERLRRRGRAPRRSSRVSRRRTSSPGRAAPARAARVALRRLSADPARAQQGARAPQRSRVHWRRRPASWGRASPSVVPPAKPRAVRAQLAHQRARPLQAARRRRPHPASRHRADRLPAAHRRSRRCKPKPARRAATTSGSRRA